jgi:hypothetical protein
MQNKQETITLHVNGKKTKVGVQPINVVTIPDKRDEKPVSGEQKGSDNGADA